MKEIPITSFDNLQIGQAENTAAGTGCTVVLLGKDGAPAGLDVRGGGPASRESELLKPLAAAQVIHAIVLAGGSAFGLDAAGGVMRYLEERGIGFDVGVTKVPLVCQSDLFDLTVADARTRPDAAMAYAACVNAETGNYRDGNHGAGTGATVGKLLGMDHCMKSGIGSYAVQVGDLKVGALVAVNAMGDVYDFETGRKVAGLRADDGKTFLDSERVLMQQFDAPQEKFRRQHDTWHPFHQCKARQGAVVQGRGHGARRLRPRHPPGAHLDGRRQHLRGLAGRGAR